MIDLRWFVAGLIIGMLMSTVFIPPTRKLKSVPAPNDSSVYHTETGCVRFVSEEVPCVEGADSLNLLASLGKKQ
jgi:hypothetical protein